MSEFEGVVAALSQALLKRGYDKLTQVQEAVLAPELIGRDALVSAQTGSGKTVAFGLAMASTLLWQEDQLEDQGAPMALIVAPTRELALQVKKELSWLYREAGASIVSCVGGMDPRSEKRALDRGAHIVVGTPGRLCDHIRRGALETHKLKVVVLDEADEMLDLGFRDDLEFILETTPEERRTLLFSATVPPSIAKLASRFQREAVRVTTVSEREQHGDIGYRVLAIAPREQENAIINVLRYYEVENALVFCNTRAAVSRMMARLNNRGFSVVALSGELTQNERSHALQALRDGRARVCIATDVAARGIDLPKLDLVIHAELPTNPETLLHRSGRTGRAGRKGVSVLLADVKTKSRAQRLLHMAKIDAEWANPPSAEEVLKRDEERILADPLLNEAEFDHESEFVDRLLNDFSVRQIATAFVRAAKGGKSAPEDLQIVSLDNPKKRGRDKGQFDPVHSNRRGGDKRENFAESVWVSLSVGRAQNAEPRWLIPMICKASGLTKASIGTIKMQQSETFVEVNADDADMLFAAIGKNKTLERNIRVKHLDEAPRFSEKSDEKSRAGRPKQRRASRGSEKPDFKKHGKKKPKANALDSRPVRKSDEVKAQTGKRKKTR